MQFALILPSECCDPVHCPGQHSDCYLDLESSSGRIAECCILVWQYAFLLANFAWSLHVVKRALNISGVCIAQAHYSITNY